MTEHDYLRKLINQELTEQSSGGCVHVTTKKDHSVMTGHDSVRTPLHPQLSGGAKMYLSAVEKLIRFLLNPGISGDELCKYLALETFAQSKTSAIYIGSITQDGYISPLTSFGIPTATVSEWGNVPLNINAPFTEAIKQDKIVILKNEEMLVRYPVLANYEGIPSQWESYLVCPLLPLGIVALTLDTTPKLDQKFELFLRTVSTITLQYLLVKCKCDGTSRKPGISGKLLKSGSLTERQQIIKNLIEKGLTNPAIADEIGYSESLVRQETMAIYAVLNISGRKDLLGYSGGGS